MLQASPPDVSNDARRLDAAAHATAEALARNDLDAAHQAFRTIHDFYFWRINRFIRARLVASPDAESEADELTSETFLQLWRQIGTFDPARGPLSGLLFIIARRLTQHRSRSHLQRRALEAPRTPEEPSEQALEAAAAGAAEAAVNALTEQVEASWREDNRARLLQELEQSTPDVHRFLTLRYHELLPFREVASRLRISHDSARQRDITARLALFRAGWRLIREEEARAGRALKWYRPQSVAEIVAILREDPQVSDLFTEYFGASSWRLVGPRRESHVNR